MTQALAIPDYLKDIMAAGNASSDADTMASASSSHPRLSTKKSKFWFINDGESDCVGDETHVVIMSIEPQGTPMNKTYYEGDYAPDSSAPPTCTSSTGVRPDEWVQSPQNDLCATCTHNAFGTAKFGKGKACKDSKRMGVVKPDDIDGTVYILNVAATSFKSMKALASQIKKQKIPDATAVIKLGFTDAEYPQLTFDIVGFLNEENYKLAKIRHEARDWIVEAPQLEAPVNKPQIEDQKGNNPNHPAAQVDNLKKAETVEGDILDKW